METGSKFVEFKRHFEPFGVLSTADIRKWNPSFDSRRLVEWQQKNYLQRIVNRWYLFTDQPVEDQFLFLVANRIYSPSYVSFESALAYYHLIPEAVYATTSATSLKTKRMHTVVGTFIYRHLKPELFFGYRFTEVRGHCLKIAEPEKTILDFLYLHPDLQTAGDFNSLRINKEVARTLIKEELLREYLSLFRNAALARRVSTFMSTIGHA